MKFFREKQQCVIFGIAAVLVVGFVVFRYFPLRRRIKEAESKKINQMFIINKAADEASELPQLKEQIVNFQKALEKYDKNIPTQKGLGGFLQEITDLMDKHKLNEQLIQPGGVIKTETLNCIPLNMQCSGRLNQIFEFYRSLDGMDRLVRIVQVELSNSREFSGELKMRTEAFIYYRSSGEQG